MQGFAHTHQNLEGFGGLNAANNAHQRCQHTRGGAAQFGHLIRFREQAVVTGRIVVSQVVHRDLTRETDGGTGNKRLAVFDTSTVDRMTCGKVVATIEHEIGLGYVFRQRLAGQFFNEGVYVHFGIQLPQHGFARFGLADPDTVGRVQDLALQVAQFNVVVICQGNVPHAGSGQVAGHRGAQATGTDNQYASSLELFLAFNAQFVEQDVAGVTQELLVVEVGGCHGFLRA